MIWIRCPHFIDEKSFTTYYLKSIKNCGGFAYKISDMDCNLKRFDAFSIIDWDSSYMEIKVWFEKNRCDLFNKLRPNQKAWLRLVAQNWWNAEVIYYNKRYNEYYHFDFLEDTQKIIREYPWKK